MFQYLHSTSRKIIDAAVAKNMIAGNVEFYPCVKSSDVREFDGEFYVKGSPNFFLGAQKHLKKYGKDSTIEHYNNNVASVSLELISKATELAKTLKGKVIGVILGFDIAKHFE